MLVFSFQKILYTSQRSEREQAHINNNTKRTMPTIMRNPVNGFPGEL
jgi:hypothetical protein